MKMFRIGIILLLMSPHYGFAREIGLFYQCEDYQTVAITKLPTGHDVISAELNGITSRFVLDTGTKFSVIDERHIEKYHIDQSSLKEVEKSAGAAGEILINSYALESLAINGHKLNVKKIGTTDLSQVINGLGGATGVWVDGIIGQDVLINHFGIIDNRHKKLFLRPSSQLNSECSNSLKFSEILGRKGFQAIPMKMLSIDLATINVIVNNTPGEFILDSGAGAIIVDEGSLANFHLNDKRVISSQSSSGAGGAFTVKTLELGSLQIGARNYPLNSIKTLDLSAVVNEVKIRSGARIHGVIGQDLLQRYRSIISFHDTTLYLKP